MYPLRGIIAGVSLTLCVALAPNGASRAAADDGDVAPATDRPSERRTSRTWLDGLQAGIRQGQTKQQPLLVFAGSETCPWCRRLKAQFDAEPLARELGPWALAYVDVDRRPADARRLRVGAVPALRILNVRGITIASREGLASPDELIGWLREHYTQAMKAADPSLLESGEPNVLAIVRLVRQLDQRDPTQREAAIKRLAANRQQAATAVVKAFRSGNLATRLAVLEILQQWRAPVDGLDPWRPETITPDRLAELDAWRETAPAAEPPPVETLNADDLAQAREQIDRLLKTDGVMAAAVRGRLARLGPALLPEVYERLKNIENDEQREKLLALRYRLVAGDSLIVRWPGGITRLASSDVDQRREAAEQLSGLATAEDQALLLELFSDPDPLIRELSLRSLEHLGGSAATASLAKLLNDPEPNVRAAVLKRLAEDAPQDMLAQVAAYVADEQDPDLLVHAIRYFKAVQSKPSVQALLPLLEHESWQVRAEAAEAIGGGGSFDNMRIPGLVAESQGVEVAAALIKLLADPDPFVVSRAVQGLAGADMVIAVEPFVKAAETHADLAPQIVEILAGGEQMRPKALPHLKRFRNHETPEIRAAAITGLAGMVPDSADQWVVSGLRDESRVVRLAAADVVLEQIESLRDQQRQTILDEQLGRNRPHVSYPYSYAPPVARESLSSRIIKSLFGGLRKSKDETEEVQPAGTETEPEPEPEPAEDGSDELNNLPDIGSDHASKFDPNEEAPPFNPDNEADPDPPRLVRPRRPEQPSDAPDLTDLIELELSRDAPGQTPPGPDQDGLGNDAGATDGTQVALGDPGLQWDQWLADYQSGKSRPKWLSEVIGPLTAMLPSDDVTERLRAATILVALGHQDAALPILREIAVAQPHLSAAVAGVLPWLPWSEREVLFDELLARAATKEIRGQIVESMSRVLDHRAAGRLWAMLEDPAISQDMAAIFDDALSAVYFGESYHADEIANVALKREITAAARPRTEAGSDLKRLVALVMLAQVDAPEALLAARRIADDPAVGPALHRDAFQVMLATSPKLERPKTAAAALADDDPVRQQVAIRYLVENDDALRYLRGYAFNVPVVDYQGRSYTSGQPIIPAVPPGVVRADMLPLLESENPQIRAYAAYLLALLEDTQGMPVLLEYWREKSDDESRMELVYRAIAVLDDASYLPALRQIYQQLDEYDRPRFYWTIRIMSGPEILSFRKQIRDEIGAENLR